jgi:hypothetical protein
MGEDTRATPTWAGSTALKLEENMGKKQYAVESEFDDLHGNPDDAPDLELDLSDSDNPIIKAALSGEDDDNWQPPENDDDDDPKNKKPSNKDDDLDDDNDDEDDLEELDDDDEEDGDEDDDEDDDEEDGDEDDDEEDDDEDDDEDDKKYSKNVQKRIDRERSLRKAESDQSNRRIRKLEKKIELRDAKDDFAKEEREAQSKLRKLKKQKVEALDEDDNAKAVEIDDEILDIKADLKAKQLQLDAQLEDLDSDDSEDTASGTPAAGQVWLEKYPQFHSNAQFRNTVLQADKMVAGRGFDKNTEEYYEEMEKILKPQFPKIIKGKTAVKKKPKKRAKKKRSAVGGTSKAGTRQTRSNKGRRRRVIRLTKADQRNMEIFGMDPTNPAEARAWAESKQD